MSLIIYSRLENGSERRWICEWLFTEVFGIPCQFVGKETQNYEVEFEGAFGRLVLPDIFLACAPKAWLSAGTLPSLPLSNVLLGSFPDFTKITGSNHLPTLYREEGVNSFFSYTKEDAVLNLDILGSLFFLMSRYEEVVVKEVDSHARFPASASVLGKAGLLDRAIGNEYIEILWAAMKRVWPGLERKKREFRVLPSHDIDFPSSYWGFTKYQLFRQSLGHLRRGQVKSAALKAWAGGRYPHGDWRHDPLDTLDLIMDISEKHGLQSAFYYIPEQTDPKLDLGMPLNHPQIEDQWKRIAGRGHEIGLHPGYNSFGEPERIQRGAEIVRKQLRALGIEQDVLGGRQHYLRWKTPDTASAWAAAGLDYDSSLAYAEVAGFRSGICYEYPMYDVVKRRPLNLRQRPLVVMECTLIDERYMNLGISEDALEAMIGLKRECRKYDGDFTVLWHNQRFLNPKEREIYEALLGA